MDKLLASWKSIRGFAVDFTGTKVLSSISWFIWFFFSPSTNRLRYIIIIIQLIPKPPKITAESMRLLILENIFFSFESDSLWVLFVFYLIGFNHTSWQAMQLPCVINSSKHAYQVANNTLWKFKSSWFATIQLLASTE